MIIDGVLGSQCVDSSGEILDVEGADISDLEEGKGVLNYEHKGAEDKTSNGQEIVGKILTAKKVFKESDCDNARQRAFWKKVRHPFIYGVCRLYDGAGHEGAKALAAQIRDHHANNEPILVRFSVEGSTLEKEGNTLKRSVIRRVALTLKPCNKTADSGLIEDPNAPAGFEKKPGSRVGDILADIAEDAKKMEHQHPGFTKLGGVTETEYSEFTEEDHAGLIKSLAKLKAMRKALEAGSYDAAPSTLTQGAALQREDRHGLKNRAMKSLKSYLDKQEGFDRAQLVTILKQDLPEASDDFIDHFANIAEDYHVKLRKDEAPAKKPAARRTRKPKLSDLTVQGVPVVLSDRYKKGKNGGPFIDQNEGTLHTAQGVFPLNMVDPPHPHQANRVISLGQDPKQAITDTFQQALAKTRDAHQRAMAHWMPLNERFRTGQVSPELVSHAILFSLMSPGNPVAMQEHMFSHAVDAMHAHGLGAVTNANQWRKVGKDWLKRNWKAGEPGQLPAHSREYFERLINSVPPGTGVRGLYTKDGRVQSFGKPQQLYEYFGNYLANHHKRIMEAIRDNPGNGQLPARLLSDAHGFGNKLARYTMGMLGAGNVVVPDTHFLRHTFGLQPDLEGNRPGSSPDNATFEHLRATATDSARANDVMEGIDKYYLQHHPSVRAVMADPVLGPYFKQHPEQALFPSFWWHWTSVPGHEAMMGTPNASAANSDVDHQPFWAATEPFRKAEGAYDPFLPIRTAAQHHMWVQEHGEEPALQLYLEHLVPKLLANDALAPTGEPMYATKLHPDDQHQAVLHPEDGFAHGMLNATQRDEIPMSVHEPLNRAVTSWAKYGQGANGDDMAQKVLSIAAQGFGKHIMATEGDELAQHPATRFVLETYPKHFIGKEQEAVVPAAWARFLADPHHRELCGEVPDLDKDHGLFWDNVQDELIKNGLEPRPTPSQPTPLDPWPAEMESKPAWVKGMGAFEALRKRWGETPALLALFSHIAPKMVAESQPTVNPVVMKAEAILIDLKKAFATREQLEKYGRAHADQALREVAPHVNHVYAFHLGPDGKIGRHPAGRFLTAGQHLHVLEDYHGDLGDHLTEGPLDADKLAQISAFKDSHRHEVVPLSEMLDGQRPELWTPPDFQPRPPSVFEVVRHGQETPDHLEFVGGVGHLNGVPLKPEQLKAILHHARNGHAAVRYKHNEQESKVLKMELVFQTLMKGTDPQSAENVHSALDRLDQLVRDGLLEPHHAEALRNHAFKDPMTGNVMGNKFAYQDFLNRTQGRGGIHVVMDGNDFKSVNDKFGHETGDHAIKAMGGALRSAMDEAVGQGEGKLFRVGGDEFAAHVPTHEHAARFARALRDKLEALTPIQGTHRLSMGLGFGADPHSADLALYEAKKQKYDPAGMAGNDSRKWVSKFAPGAAPSFAHSLVPGFEGPVPLHTASSLPVKPPPEPMPKPPAPEPLKIVKPPVPSAPAATAPHPA